MYMICVTDGTRFCHWWLQEMLASETLLLKKFTYSYARLPPFTAGEIMSTILGRFHPIYQSYYNDRYYLLVDIKEIVKCH